MVVQGGALKNFALEVCSGGLGLSANIYDTFPVEFCLLVEADIVFFFQEISVKLEQLKQYEDKEFSRGILDPTEKL